MDGKSKLEESCGELDPRESDTSLDRPAAPWGGKDPFWTPQMGRDREEIVSGMVDACIDQSPADTPRWKGRESSTKSETEQSSRWDPLRGAWVQVCPHPTSSSSWRRLALTKWLLAALLLAALAALLSVYFETILLSFVAMFTSPTS